MKPDLIFQVLSIYNDGVIETVTLGAAVEGVQISVTTLPAAAETVCNHQKFREALAALLLKATIVINNKGKVIPVYQGISLVDNLSCYRVRQTVGFNNNMHKAGLDTSVILAAIW